MRKRVTTWGLTAWAVCVLALLLPGLSKAQFQEDGKRYAIFSTHLPDDPTGDKAVRDVTYALDNGCNAVEIGIKWFDLYRTATSAPAWGRFDKVVNLARARNVKIAFRIITLRQENSTFWSEDQIVRDSRGNPLFPRGDTHFRFGHTPSVNKAQDFIRSIIQRYQYLNQQGQLLFVSVVTTPYLELEYFQVNWPMEGGTPYNTMYDFNDMTIGDFQQWAMRKYGNSLAEVNRRWSTDYRNVSDIRPTYPNAEGRQGHMGARGLDWYAFRHYQMKAFNDRCIQTIKSVDPTIRVINQHGSVYDILSETRGTYGFKNLAELADGVKVNDGLDYAHQFSMDLLRSNVKPGQWFFNELDGSTYLNDRIDRSTDQVNMMKTCFKFGAKGFTLANFLVGYNEGYLKAILDKMKAQGVLDQPMVTNISPAGTVTYKLSRLVQSNIHELGITAQWMAVRGNDEKPVRLLVDEDILDGASLPDNAPPTVQNAIPNQETLLGQSFSYQIPANTFADSDGQISSISVSGLPSGFAYNAVTRTISGTSAAAGSNEVTVTATDDKGATISDYFTLAVRQRASALRLLDPLLSCSTGRFEFRTTDGDGTSIEYKLEGITEWSTNATITLDQRYRNGSALDVKARQSSNVTSLTYTTTCSSVNRPPVVAEPIPDQTFTVNMLGTYTIPAATFSDPDGEIASVAVTGLPSGVSYDPVTRYISGTITTLGSWTITATATDDRGATVSDIFVLTSSTVRKPLRLVTPIVNCNTGRFEFQTADGDGSPIEFFMDRVFDWTTQRVHTLTESVLRNDMHYRARQNGEIVYGTYLPNCPPANKPPVVATPLANLSITQFRNVSAVVPLSAFSDPDGRIIGISLAGLPGGLTYDTNTRTIGGAATDPGSWTVTATATDDREGTVSTTFVIAVTRDIKALRLLTPTLTCNTGRLEFKTADGDGTTIQYSIDGIMNWTTQNNYNLALALRFNTTLTIRARQGSNEVTLSYQTNCPRTNLPPVVASHIANQVITVNQPASIAIPPNTFSDPDGQITSLTLTGLPVGLSYDPTRRVVSGTPSLIGSSAVIAKATDNAGASVSDTFLITVRSAPRFTATVAMVDAQNKTVRAVNEGDLIDIQKLPDLINLSCTPRTTSGSVVMELTGKARRTTYANAGPYVVYPGGQGFKPVLGTYQLKISAYSGVNGTGTLQGTTTVRFDIVQTSEPGSIEIISEK